ncbi:MAG: BMC domain-containing protein, partial [Myxococcota bacterium]
MATPKAIVPPSFEALALLEIDGMPRAVRAQDVALKRASITVLGCAPVSPGKALLLLVGHLADVEEAFAAARTVVGNRLIDELLLPAVHGDLIAAILAAARPTPSQTLAILELATVGATLGSADRALKSAEVGLSRLHLATGYG